MAKKESKYFILSDGKQRDWRMVSRSKLNEMKKANELHEGDIVISTGNPKVVSMANHVTLTKMD